MSDQLKSEDFLGTVKNYIKSFWGEEVDVVFEEQKAQDHQDSLQTERKTKQEQELEEMKKKIENLDVIKSMKQKYKVEIKDISKTSKE